MGRRRRSGLLALATLSVGLGMTPTGAKAQLFGSGAAPTPPSGGAAALGVAPPTGVGPMGMYGNPYMNPMFNPYMNPYLTQGTTTPGNAAMYFFAAQQMNGGIGSGRIGGPRAASAGTARPKGADAAPAEAQRLTGANTPGATASRYFNRATPAGTGTARYYGRPSRHFPNNGR